MEYETWDDVIHAKRIRPGGGYAKVAEALEMNRSRLTAILRGRALPAERSYKGETPEVARLSKEFGLTQASVRTISTNTRVRYLEGVCERTAKQRKKTSARAR